MIQVNEYFEGNVKSLSIAGAGGKETVGVMASGQYIFNTGLKELITVVSGALTVKLAEDTEWSLYQVGETFEVPANSAFELKVMVDTAYLCQCVG